MSVTRSHELLGHTHFITDHSTIPRNDISCVDLRLLEQYFVSGAVNFSKVSEPFELFDLCFCFLHRFSTFRFPVAVHLHLCPVVVSLFIINAEYLFSFDFVLR